MLETELVNAWDEFFFCYCSTLTARLLSKQGVSSPEQEGYSVRKPLKVSLQRPVCLQHSGFFLLNIPKCVYYFF